MLCCHQNSECLHLWHRETGEANIPNSRGRMSPGPGRGPAIPTPTVASGGGSVVRGFMKDANKRTFARQSAGEPKKFRMASGAASSSTGPAMPTIQDHTEYLKEVEGWKGPALQLQYNEDGAEAVLASMTASSRKTYMTMEQEQEIVSQGLREANAGDFDGTLIKPRPHVRGTDAESDPRTTRRDVEVVRVIVFANEGHEPSLLVVRNQQSGWAPPYRLLTEQDRVQAPTLFGRFRFAAASLLDATFGLKLDSEEVVRVLALAAVYVEAAPLYQEMYYTLHLTVDLFERCTLRFDQNKEGRILQGAAFLTP